jgi:hypothetical protein
MMGPQKKFNYCPKCDGHYKEYYSINNPYNIIQACEKCDKINYQILKNWTPEPVKERPMFIINQY